MTAIETLERAISELETLRDAATPGPWIARYDGDEPYEFDHEEGIPDDIMVGGGRWITSPGIYGTTDVLIEVDGFGLEMDEAKVVAANADLVTALSRTVEPLLQMHRRSLMSMKRAIGSGMSEADVETIAEMSGEVALARAILGEEAEDE